MFILSKTVKAGMLPFVVMISFIMTSICLSMLLSVYYFNLITIRYSTEARLMRNIQSVGNFVLANPPDFFDKDDIVQFDLFNDSEDSISIVRKRWGVLNLFVVEAFSGRFRKSDAFFVGNNSSMFPGSAIYLSDKGISELFLAGNTIINGDVYIPKLGVSPGYYNNRSFRGETLINGEVVHSQSSIPEINSEVLHFFRMAGAAPDLDFEDVMENEVSQSFTKSTRVFHFYEPMDITNVLRGNINIVSSQPVTISNSSFIEDAIIVAPEIHIEKGFRGSLQLFAGNRIEIEDEVELMYPSFVVCENTKQSSITVGDNCNVEGGLFLIGEKSNGEVLIGNSLIKGMVVSSGNVELQGKVYGQVICEGFVKHGKNDKIFINYLVDCEVNYGSLSPFFLYPDLYQDYSGRYEKLKSLY